MENSYLSLLEADLNRKPEDVMTYTGPASKLYPPGPLSQEQNDPSIFFYGQTTSNHSLMIASHATQAPQFRDLSSETTDEEAQAWWNGHFWEDGPMNPPGTAFLVPKWQNPSRATYAPTQPLKTNMAVQQSDSGGRDGRGLDMAQHWGWQLGVAYNDERLREQTAKLQEMNREKAARLHGLKQDIVRVQGSGLHLLAPGGGAVPLGPHLKPPLIQAPPGSPTPLSRATRDKKVAAKKRAASPSFDIYDETTASSSSEADDEDDEDYVPSGTTKRVKTCNFGQYDGAWEQENIDGVVSKV